MLSRLSVSLGIGNCLRLRCSSRSLRISPLHREFHPPLLCSSSPVLTDPSRLSREISQKAYPTTYAPCTPSKSEQRLPPSYYRGCWHEVSRGCFCRYRPNGYPFHLPCRKGFTIRRPSSPTRRRCVRLSSIAQYSLLLPPVGVWPVSQCQCG